MGQSQLRLATACANISSCLFASIGSTVEYPHILIQTPYSTRKPHNSAHKLKKENGV
jgi:hypothetical protein